MIHRTRLGAPSLASALALLALAAPGMAPALAGDAAAADQQQAMQGAEAARQDDALEEAPVPADPPARGERMRATGSRVGFRYDTRPTGKMATVAGKRRVVIDDEDEVASRPTRWGERSLGGETVHELRFRREGEPEDQRP